MVFLFVFLLNQGKYFIRHLYQLLQRIEKKKLAIKYNNNTREEVGQEMKQMKNHTSSFTCVRSNVFNLRSFLRWCRHSNRQTLLKAHKLHSPQQRGDEWTKKKIILKKLKCNETPLESTHIGFGFLCVERREKCAHVILLLPFATHHELDFVRFFFLACEYGATSDIIIIFSWRSFQSAFN